MTELQRLKGLLSEHGFEFEVSAGDGNLIVSVQVDEEPVHLPEELKPFAWEPDQVDRAIWKGNTEKKTYGGANFELALMEYASAKMHEDPETIELDEAMDWTRKEITLAELSAYQAKRKEIWDRICQRPEIVEWEKQLDTLL